jgi:predicted transcriptional regulator
LGKRGLLVIKDVTSILSMNRDTRGAVLAALREVYDGRWSRNVGTDGGRTLTWEGRIVVIGAVTSAWDSAHAVVAAMGDRFLIVRLDSRVGGVRSGRQAIRNTGDEEQMRKQLKEEVGALLRAVDYKRDLTLTAEEAEDLLIVADVVTLARTAVEHDARGYVIDAHAPEMPTRFAKQLTQIMRGGLSLGMSRERAMQVAQRCAHDSMPPLRLGILLDLLDHPDATTTEVRRRLGKPRNTIDRTLQALHMLELVIVEEETRENGQTTWKHRLADESHQEALRRLRASGSRNVSQCIKTSEEETHHGLNEGEATVFPSQQAPTATDKSETTAEHTEKRAVQLITDQLGGRIIEEIAS